MKIKKCLKKSFSLLLAICMACGLVGGYIPSGTVEAASGDSTYTVTMAGTSGDFYFGNKTATTSEYVVLKYTVKENSVGTATVGNNGVIATTAPTSQYPYNGTGSMKFNGTTNYLMREGCTYTLKLSLAADGKITVDGSYTDAAGNVTGGLVLGLGSGAGSANTSCQYFGVYIAGKVSGKLTNVSCVDANGNDLGLMSNQSNCVIEKNVPKYTVTMAGTSGDFYFGNKTATTSEYVVLKYTVKENSVGTATVGNNGVIATTAPTSQYPYNGTGSMKFNGTTNYLMREGCTYTLKLYLAADGKITVDGSYTDAAGNVTGGLVLGLGSGAGSANTSCQYFGVYIAGAVSGTLTNVSCVDANGNDLGLMSNQSSCVIEKNVPKYTVTMAGKSNFYLGNKTATTSEYVVLTYTVKENSVGTASVGNNGVIATTSPSSEYPYNGTGSMKFNGTTNYLMREGCTYTLKLYLAADGKITVDGSYTDAAGNVTGGLVLGLGSGAGSANTSCQYFGVYIAGAVSGTLTNVSCVDANGNDLGLMSNQSSCVIEENKVETEEPEENTGYTVTLTGKTDFYLGNRIPTTSEYVVLTYTVKENSVGTASVGNNGVVATTNPNTQYPYHQVGSMHFNGSTNWLMKEECTYTLKLYLDDNGFITVDGKYIDAAGNETAGLILALGNKTGANNKDYQYFGIYIANAVSGTLTSVSCVDAEGNDLGLMSNQSSCVIVNPDGYQVVTLTEDIVVSLDDSNGYEVTAADGATIDGQEYANGTVFSTVGDHQITYIDGNYIYTGNLIVFAFGDVDIDTDVDVVDLIEMKIKIIDGDACELSKAGEEAADFDLDDIIDDFDADLMREYLVTGVLSHGNLEDDGVGEM